ncbi:MAG: response regulator [Nitrospirota bacterium]
MIKILIVDDDDGLRSVLSDILQDKGYATDEASSGDEAIEKATSTKYDVVLLDLVMPKMGGMDVLSEIRKINTQTRVIMITAFATVDSAVEAIKKGAVNYISKPFSIDALDVAIRRALEEAKFDERSGSLGLDNALKYISNSIRRDMLKLMEINNGMRLMEMTKVLDIEDHTKVSFHLKMLKDAGIIKQNRKTYYLSKEGHEILTCLKILESHFTDQAQMNLSLQEEHYKKNNANILTAEGLILQ